MNKDLRIIFMGTPQFAVNILDALVAQNYNIVGVVTAPDRPSGRGQKLSESAVKQFALKQGLPILQPTNLKNETFLQALEALDGNLQVVVAFRMLPQVVWQMPEHGTFNLHASLLPEYRGAAPINWAIINGEQKTGVTTFFIDEKIDTGELILQEEIEISTTENAGQLHDKLMFLGSAVVIKTVELIKNGEVKREPQRDLGSLKTAHKLTKANCKIDWNDTIYNIHNKIRGLSPYPGAWCELNNGGEVETLKIYKSTVELTEHNLEVGTILCSKHEAKVAVSGGYVLLLELQLAGKRKMDIKSLLNGFKFQNDAKML